LDTPADLTGILPHAMTLGIHRTIHLEFRFGVYKVTQIPQTSWISFLTILGLSKP